MCRQIHSLFRSVVVRLAPHLRNEKVATARGREPWPTYNLIGADVCQRNSVKTSALFSTSHNDDTPQTRALILINPQAQRTANYVISVNAAADFGVLLLGSSFSQRTALGPKVP
jgi:hypothetical protein